MFWALETGAISANSSTVLMRFGEARAWNGQVNAAKTKINWQFTRKDARQKLEYQR